MEKEIATIEEIAAAPELTTEQKIDEIHSIIGELKGLETKLLPILEGMQKNPMLKMFFK